MRSAWTSAYAHEVLSGDVPLRAHDYDAVGHAYAFLYGDPYSI
ncbi:MAG: hypothetical protein ACPGJU_04690 [Coraliomargarita sp.]